MIKNGYTFEIRVAFLGNNNFGTPSMTSDEIEEKIQNTKFYYIPVLRIDSLEDESDPESVLSVNYLPLTCRNAYGVGGDSTIPFIFGGVNHGVAISGSSVYILGGE